MKAIRSLKAFNAGVAELAAGEVDAFGASNHQELTSALYKYAHRASGRFSELAAYISEAEEKGFSARQRNRAQAIADLDAKIREERLATRSAAHREYDRELQLSRIA